ncbi:MAG: hypothetical protein BWZ07_02650 [Alphaproteobacteria bacterium ADurb.BinA280]|nr:MAG: hypothetical protein BWZ07_02650 [Alphaproteobacteria bacterium ADurb.BinA280]
MKCSPASVWQLKQALVTSGPEKNGPPKASSLLWSVVPPVKAPESWGAVRTGAAASSARAEPAFHSNSKAATNRKTGMRMVISRRVWRLTSISAVQATRPTCNMRNSDFSELALDQLLAATTPLG